MRLKIMLPLLALIVMLGLPSQGMARQIHDFDCANCHKPNASLTSVGNIVCLDCHIAGMVGFKLDLLKNAPGQTEGVSNATFAVGDASDAMGSVTAQLATPGDESSHNWAAADKNPAAGATAPSNRRFYGRSNYSGKTVNCGRCHDPHGYQNNPSLLKLGTGTEAAMCDDCHVGWASDTAPSEGGGVPTNVHPMVTDYATIAAAKSTEYNDVATLNATAGEVALNSSGGIDCLSCHGVHFADSDSSTTDGAGQTLNPGDGKVLKANGASFDQANVAGVSLCQACHKYKDHGTGRTNPIGCLVCHAAHLEDTGGSMNNYMLRSSITTYMPNGGATGTVNGLTANITDTPAQNTRLWAYCFNCHDSVAAAVTHNASWTCSDCHSHDSADGSWAAAGGCNKCHGYPPSENIVSDGDGGNAGYAAGYDTSGHFKNETLTKHVAHAGGGTDYAFKCSTCHKNNDHIGGNFADAILTPYDALIDGSGRLTGGNEPAYVAATGTCSNIYCHSNGGPRGSTPTVNNPGVWENGTVINTCDACHGNDSTSMTTRSNSIVHIKHLNAGYGCQVCHADTATSSSALKATAIQLNGEHVNGTADIAFDGGSLDLTPTSYGTDGTCSVYCHSNSTTRSTPDWDNPLSGKCGTCHQADSADTFNLLSDPHSLHLFDAGGPQLYKNSADYGCDNCHTHQGSGADHVNGSLPNLTPGACDACHGSDGVSTSGDDRIPVWTNSATVSCDTCHSGLVIADITAAVTTPAKTAYDSAGHGKPGVAQNCTLCHDPSADSNHLGTLDDTDRLRVFGGTAYDAADSQPYCSTLCHSGEDNHYANSNTTDQATNTSTDGNNCVICHDPHGQQDKNSADLDAMVRADINGQVVTGFTDKADRTKYYNTVDVGEGICQTCHDPNEVNNFNRTTANTGHGGVGVCISCHQHTTAPAFKAACNGCHGDETTGQYWPYGSGGIIPTANDEVGEHDVHVLAISQKLGYGDIATLLAAADTATKQKAICEYCHAATSNDSDHGLVGGLDADVFVDADATRHAKFIGDGTADADAAYDNAADTCSNVDCHNSKLTLDNSYGWHDGAANPGCILCHNDMTDTGTATGLTHSAHTGASATYGVTINCASCHDAATNWATKTKPASNHIDGTFDIGGTVTLTYGGSLPTGSSFGSCGTNACHEDGQGNASVEEAGDGYVWGTAEASACGICHSATPTSGDHTVHLSGTYGPGLGTDCSGCHKANANNTSMASMTTHLNGSVTFNNVATPASPYAVTSGEIATVGNEAVDSCDLCHGGNTAANIAKDYWTTADRVTCGSCHGDYTAAEINSVTAPVRAGSAYTSWGHGRTTGNAPNQACSDCHAESSAHINGALGEDRLDTSPITGYDYSVVGQKNDFCNDCHTTIGAVNVHFDNTNTAGGTSTDGLYCVTCHDPHGQDNFDAMVKADVGGNTVSGFTDRTARTSYRNASFEGVCQTCHDGSEVSYFNQSTDNNAGHNSGSNCVSCHPHTTNPAFKASCNGCHGDSATGQYWPDGDTDTQINAANNDAGRHDEHVLLISQKLGYGDIATLLADADTDTKQRAICTYCHAVNDDDHAIEANLPAEVFNATVGSVATDVAKAIWDGSTDADASYNSTDKTCATVDCHKSKTTTNTAPNDYSWNGANSGSCVMCHNDIISGGNASRTTHTAHTAAAGTYGLTIGCTDCHEASTDWAGNTAPATGHINGTFSVDKASAYPHFSYSGDWAMGGAFGTCGTNDCHNDGKDGAPALVATWGGADPGFCNKCHSWWAAEAHVAHSDAEGTIVSGKFGSFSCTNCHTHVSPGGTKADHINRTVDLLSGMNYSGNVDVGTAGFGNCSTTSCHTNGRGVVVATPAWDSTPSGTNDCTLCHGTLSGGLPTTGFHGEHAKNPSSPVDYTSSTGVASDAGNYDFGCGNCHSIALTQHIDGGVDVTLNSTHGGAIKALNNIANDTGGYVQTQGSSVTCSAAYCHSYIDAGGTRQYATTPDWYGSGFVGDSCAGCHANSPVSNAHQGHEVGFHYDVVYSGLAGFMPVLDSDTVPVGLTYTDKDEIRGHGGRLSDAVTSTSTVITCNVCHWSTVTNYFNDQNSTCVGCHNDTDAPTKGNMTIADKSNHINGGVEVVFFPQTVRTKAQLRDDLADVAEISNNWSRVNNYKASDGSSYDEQTDTLANLSSWTAGDKTCTTSCHLWEASRVDKVPINWEAGSITCIDCHTRLPK